MADLDARREAMRALEAMQIVDRAASTGTSIIGGVPCVEASAGLPRAIIVHAHGGGFCMGEAVAWRGFASRIAVKAAARVVVPDYRLAPEYPFPAALQDIDRVVRGLLADEADMPLFIAGDSSGSSLALAVASTMREELAGVILLSPWLDLTVSARSYAANGGTDNAFSGDQARVSAARYLQGVSADDPLASPLFVDLAGMPPMLAMVSQGEVLLDDTLALIARSAAAGVPVRGHIVPSVPHVWPLLMPNARATQEAIAAIATFVQGTFATPA